jgi:hypothetical protein
MAYETAQVFSSYERLEERKRLFYPSFQDVCDYVIPRKGNLFGKTEGQKKTEKLYDATAINSNELLAASLQGSLTSPVIQWFNLTLSDDRLNEDHLVSIWLDIVSKTIYQALNHSNFNAEIFEVYLDLGGFGTSCLFVDEAAGPNLFNGLIFDSLDIGEYVIDEDRDGFVDTVFRTWPLSARNAVAFFGPKAPLSEKIKEAAIEKPELMFDFLQVVTPRGYSGKFGADGMPFSSCWYEKEKKTLIKESGYPEFPFMVTRWLKTSGELYGRSPSFTAMPDIKSLNKSQQLLFRAWGKSIDPPLLMLDDGVIGSVKLTPAGLNVVRSMDALMALKNEGRFDVTQIEQEKLRQGIRRMYFTDQLQLQQGGPQMTATEVQIRFELMQRLLGPTFGRMMRELLTPLIRRVFGILMRAKVLPPPPPVLQKVGVANIEIEFEGPLSRAQRSQDILAIERWFTVMAPVIQVDPTVIDILERDSIARDSAKVIGMRPSWIAGQEQVQEARNIRDQQKQLEATAAAAQVAGDLASKTAPMVKNMQDAGNINAIPPQGEDVDARLNQLLQGG